jgi:hypothetical protein
MENQIKTLYSIYNFFIYLSQNNYLIKPRYYIFYLIVPSMKPRFIRSL